MMALVYRLFDYFDLVVAFIGSAACCPTLEAMMQKHPKWDPRFFFDTWHQPLVDRLLKQQQDLKARGVTRNILILMDDVILTNKDTDQLSHMCMRGRHFNVSVFMAAVSYTSISKRARRSLDYLLCFGCPMTGDRKVLSWEYASNARMADFGLKNLRKHECVVFTTGKRELHNWRAENVESTFRSGPSQDPAETETLDDSRSEDVWASHRRGTPSAQTSTQCSQELGGAGSAPGSPRAPPGSGDECPPEAPA